jgi:hypothetical protein
VAYRQDHGQVLAIEGDLTASEIGTYIRRTSISGRYHRLERLVFFFGFFFF